MNISIIIPTLGRPTLMKVLEAILSSDGFEMIVPQILVIESPGAPANGLRQYVESLEHVEYLKSEKKGAGAARNLGLDHAVGDIIVFLGDDTIPTKHWLSHMHQFHISQPEQTVGMLGKVSWAAHLASDPFHMWLENNVQFAFHALRKYPPTWRHFYTSNVSVKRSIIGTERFSNAFDGWGFEDSEFGYRLFQKGLSLQFDPVCEVLHDHSQTLETVCKNLHNAAKNAEVFEELHPEVEIRPRGFRKLILKLAIVLTSFIAPFWQKARWWMKCKKAWIS